MLCTAVSLGWLALGAVGRRRGTCRRWRARSHRGGRGQHVGAGHRRRGAGQPPPGQAVLDYGFSALNLVLAACSWLVAARGGPADLADPAAGPRARRLGRGVQPAGPRRRRAPSRRRPGWPSAALHQIVLHGIACAAYILALLVFPTPSWDGPPGGRPRPLARRTAAVTAPARRAGHALLPHTTSCVLFFGFLVPAVGLLVLPRRAGADQAPSADAGPPAVQHARRRRSRCAVVLAVVTVLLSVLGDAPDLTLVDPTAHARRPARRADRAAVLVRRLASAAIAVVVLVATTATGCGRPSAGSAARWRCCSWWRSVAAASSCCDDRGRARRCRGLDGRSATVVVALAFGPLYVRAERVVDRLLYGTRPAPYRVLADIAALYLGHPTRQLPRRTGPGPGRRGRRPRPRRPRVPADGPGRACGTAPTSGRAGRRPRSARRPGRGAGPARRRARSGSSPSTARRCPGCTEQRQHLLADIADGLGVVLEASRSGIELERQLRAALAHAEEIAVSRRRIVAEMDGERRRIERDLHDGAQHHLVSLRLTLGLVEHQVATGDLDQARSWLEKLTEQLDAAEAVLAATADGVSSLVLRGAGAGRRAGGAAGRRASTGRLRRRRASRRAGASRRRSRRRSGSAAPRRWATPQARSRRAGQRAAHRAARGVLAFTVRDEGPGFAVDAAEGAGGGACAT